MNSIFTSYPCIFGRTRQESGRLPQVAGFLRIAARYNYPALVASAIALFIPALAVAQNTAVQPRITAQINENALTTLRGNTHPLARAQYDQGAVADTQPMQRMLLLLQRGPDQEAALKQLMDQQQSKTSPSYHKWLTPQQFGQQFGPADSDIQAVTSWLQSHGFQVARVSNGRTLIEFSGTAGQVRNAFHTEIHRYLVNGVQRFANNSDPQIPTALAPVVAGPVSLHNFPKKPQSHTIGTFRKTQATGKVTPLDTFSNPNFCGTNACNAVGPGDFATIYNVLPLWSPGIGGQVIDGTGQTIAIVGDSEICTQHSPDFGIGYSYLGPYGVNVTCSLDDVATFRTLFGLPTNSPNNSPNVILDGPDPGFNGDETEGDLDVEWSGAVAKNATIDFVIAEDTEATYGTDLAAEYVVDNNLAPVLSESFGDCEYYLGSGGNAFESTLWEQAAAQGITVIVSAGDSGSAACDDGLNDAEFGLAVNGIASTPFNVAAGGTDFDITATSYQSTYWNTTNSTVGGATYGGLGFASAKSYIPETTWNDSCAQNLTSPTATGACTPNDGGIVGGGGGQSNCIPGSDGYCDYLYGKPSWQTLPESGAGLTAVGGANPDSTRDLPDISLFAADGYVSNSFYIVCESDVNPSDAPCTLSTQNFFDFIGVGGTSSSAPTFAGMMALVNQEATILNATNSQIPTQQGNANYVLYHLFSNQSGLSCNSSTSPNSGCTFNDVTKGNNSVPCVGGEEGAFGCSSTLTSAIGVEEAVNLTNDDLTGLYGFNAAAGPDLATGLGTVNAFNLVNNWAGAVGAFTPTTTTLCLSTIEIPATETSCPGPLPAITHGTPVYVNIAVNGTGAQINTPIPVSENFSTTPSVTEDVSLVGTFPNGNPSCNIPGCITGGVDRLTSNGVEPIGVTDVPNYVVSNGDIYPLTNGTFSSATASTTAGQNFTAFLTGGTYNVVAHYGGDGTYGASSSTTPILVTVNPEGSTAETCVIVSNPFTGATTGEVLLAPSSSPPYACSAATTATYGEFDTIRVDVIGTNSLQEGATGVVNLTDNGAAVANPTGGTTSLFTLNTEGYLEDQTGYLAVGPHSFQATFSGDASYSASLASTAVPLTVTQAATATTVTASPTVIASGGTVNLTASVATVSLGNAPTGSVTFFNGATNLGTAILSATIGTNGFVAGQATLSNVKLSASGNITSMYGGDTNYTGSTSPAVSVTVGTAGVNLSPASNTATITIPSPGQSATQLITVMGQNTFAGTVTLTATVTGEPSGAVDLPTCSFAPSSISLTANSETGTSTMTCSSTAVQSAVFRPLNRPSSHNWHLVAAAGSLVCFFFLLAAPSQRRWRLVPLAVLLVVVAVAGVSCSSGGGNIGVPSNGNPGTTTGAYTITVTATPSTGTAQTTAITVNVQ